MLKDQSTSESESGEQESRQRDYGTASDDTEALVMKTATWFAEHNST